MQHAHDSVEIISCQVVVAREAHGMLQTMSLNCAVHPAPVGTKMGMRPKRISTERMLAAGGTCATTSFRVVPSSFTQKWPVVNDICTSTWLQALAGLLSIGSVSSSCGGPPSGVTGKSRSQYIIPSVASSLTSMI